jgi:hypothetical protein
LRRRRWEADHDPDGNVRNFCATGEKYFININKYNHVDQLFMNSSEDDNDFVDPPQGRSGRLCSCGEDGNMEVTPLAKRRRLTIVDSHLLGRVLATAEGQLRDPQDSFLL